MEVHEAEQKDTNTTKRKVKRRHTYILKPSGGSQGNGIRLVQTRNQLDRTIRDMLCHEPHQTIVAQRYIDPPLLLNEFKFDFRIYVLLESVSPLRIHVYRDGLARFCTTPYIPPNNENMHLVHMHLTNT